MALNSLFADALTRNQVLRLRSWIQILEPLCQLLGVNRLLESLILLFIRLLLYLLRHLFHAFWSQRRRSGLIPGQTGRWILRHHSLSCEIKVQWRDLGGGSRLIFPKTVSSVLACDGVPPCWALFGLICNWVAPSPAWRISPWTGRRVVLGIVLFLRSAPSQLVGLLRPPLHIVAQHDCVVSHGEHLIFLVHFSSAS